MKIALTWKMVTGMPNSEPPVKRNPHFSSAGRPSVSTVSPVSIVRVGMARSILATASGIRIRKINQLKQSLVCADDSYADEYFWFFNFYKIIYKLANEWAIKIDLSQSQLMSICARERLDKEETYVSLILSKAAQNFYTGLFQVKNTRARAY